MKRSLGMVAVLAIAVIATLGASAENFQRQTAGLEAAEEVVAEWLGDSDLRVIGSEYSGDEFLITLEGSEKPPPVDDLAAGIEEKLGRAFGVSVKWVPTTTFEYGIDD
ncbi:MAG: hypothetical protein E2O97_04820 [Acidobacteria bacterium]|nr:MAG: hypothetical protein E2O97_04820 [Acidobacteriota bacterium]